MEPDRPTLRNEGHDRRSHPHTPDEITPVRLTRKYAEVLNGVDLSGRHVGERLPLPPREAHLLIAEGWAAPEPRRRSDFQGLSAADRRRSR